MRPIKRYRKWANRAKIIGEWAADRGYDAWNIYQDKIKWCQLMAVTNRPIETMIEMHPTANIDWSKVRAVKLT